MAGLVSVKMGYDERDYDEGGRGGGRGGDRSRSPARGGGARETGVALRWNDRGFGFIKPDSGVSNATALGVVLSPPFLATSCEYRNVEQCFDLGVVYCRSSATAVFLSLLQFGTIYRSMYRIVCTHAPKDIIFFDYLSRLAFPKCLFLSVQSFHAS